jgi:hypothetical protein
MELTQQILKYWGESEDLDDLAIAVPVDDLFTAIVELLQSSDAKVQSQALFFARDFASWETNEVRRTIRSKQYPGSIVVQAIEVLLFSKNHFLRQQTGHALGKIYSYGSVPAMIEAFHYWRDRDPLMLPFFMGELGWLGAENHDKLADLMISSPCFITRWASISCFAGTTKREHQRRFDWLRNDLNEFVRLEAEYEYRVHLFRARGGKDFYPEPPFECTEREEIDRKYRPLITFDDMRNRFRQFLGESNRTDYTIGQLEAFIEQSVAEPKPTPPCPPLRQITEPRQSPTNAGEIRLLPDDRIML